MAKFLYFLESRTIEASHRNQTFTPSLSHDDHLIQIADAALYGEHEVYIAPVDKFDGDVEVAQLYTVRPFSLVTNSAKRASEIKFDAVITAHPDMHRRNYFPGAKTIGYFPALYFVEMQDHFMTGRMYHLLRAVQHHVDFCVFQNERQAAFMNIMCQAFAGIDIAPTSHLMPYGIPGLSAAPNFERRDQIRLEMGISKDDIVLIHGGGAWRWTDFDRFLREYCACVSGNSRANLKLIIPGLAQSHNKDHAKYIDGIEQQLKANRHLLSNRSKSDWKILYIEDWDSASKAMPNLYLASDIGVSVSSPSLEYFLSHRVRVVTYVAQGLGLLLADGDTFSTSRRLHPISHIADSNRPNGYRAVFEDLIGGTFVGRGAFWEKGADARELMTNSEIKLSHLNEILRSSPQKSIRDCPINWVFHREKVDVLKNTFEKFVAQHL